MRNRLIAARSTDVCAAYTDQEWLPIDPSVVLRYRLIAQISQMRATYTLEAEKFQNDFAYTI